MVFQKKIRGDIAKPKRPLIMALCRNTLFIIGIILFSSCAYEKITEEAPGVNQLLINNKYRINLPEEHSGGFLWQLQENYDKQVIRKINAVWHGPIKGIDFNLEALATGETTLHFVLRKHRDTLDYKHFILRIGNK
jgi:hypothetical protein